jgi:hypothetical protein
VNVLRRITIRSDLGRAMPVNLACTVTVSEFFRNFYFLDACDVWTADGWLVTAIQEDGRTMHLRRGNEVIIAEFDPTTVLHFNPNAKSIHYGFGRNADGSSLGVDDGERATQPHGA